MTNIIGTQTGYGCMEGRLSSFITSMHLENSGAWAL